MSTRTFLRASTGELASDFHYRDKIAAVEPYGVDAIPDSERHGKPVSQFFIWFAAGMNFPIMVLGFLAVSYGLSLTSSVTAIVAGSLLGSIVMGILSRMGGRLGVAQQIQARGPLGFFGNFLPVAYVNVFAGIGWAAVTVILGGQALQALVPAIPYWLGTLVLVVLQLIVAVFGYNMIHYLERILAVVLFFGFLLITVVSVSRGWQGGFGTNPGAPYWVGNAGGWITFAGFFLSFLIAWWPFASDYSRYLPDEDHINRATGFWTFAGNFISLSWLGIAGALLGSSAATGESPIDALFRLTGPFHVAGAAGRLDLIVLAELPQRLWRRHLRPDPADSRQPAHRRHPHLRGGIPHQPVGRRRFRSKVQDLPVPRRLPHRALRSGSVARLRAGAPSRSGTHR